MSIESFYVTAGYIIWAYILICVIVKLNLYVRNKKKEGSKKEKIAQFFSSRRTYRSKKNQVRVILKYSNNTELFECICKNYIKEKTKYSIKDKDLYEDLMKQILHQKIKKIDSHNDLEKCFLIQMITWCKINSDQITCFLRKSKAENQVLERFIELQKRGEPEKIR